MHRLIAIVNMFVGFCLIAGAQAQEVRRPFPSPGILSNQVTNLELEGDAVWVGPFLNVTHDGGMTWEVADADSLAGLRNRVYSIDVEGDVIWVGLGIPVDREINGDIAEIDLARGFLVSRDGGITWEYRTFLAPVDQDPTTTGILDLPEDMLTVYGGVGLPTLPITVPEQSPPWDIDYDPVTGVVWTANQLAGIRKSVDGGETWQRVVLPPDTTKKLTPDKGYVFPYVVQPVGIPRDEFFGLNFQSFSVLVDGAGRVWAGTAGGLNLSMDGGESWYHFTVADGLPGEFIISIEEQERPGRDPAVWAAVRPGDERNDIMHRFGVSVTRDGGQSFQTVLHGEPVFDFAFDGAKVYVAGDNGLFISEDDGVTFRTVRDFRDPSEPDRTIGSGSRVFSVETGPQGLWVGTSDGLFKSTDGGLTWRTFRTEVPLSPEGLPPVVPASRVPSVTTYAYPNPFSPSSNGLVRLRYRLDTDQTVVIRIFDFAMNLVRTLAGDGQRSGEREASWDGIDNQGARVANGTYFYVVEAGNEIFRGKILVLE